MLNQRTLVDVNLQKSVALPAAGATAYTPTLDLITTTAGRVGCVELQVFTSAALPVLADTHNCVFAIQDSADNVTFATAADLPTYTLTGAGGTGAAALAVQVKLPINLRRYVRASISVDASGGNNTAVTATVGLVF